jgi:hypothetical protein
MQITYKDEMRILWTGSKYLKDAIQKVPANGFPFQTTIVRASDDRFEFT